MSLTSTAAPMPRVSRAEAPPRSATNMAINLFAMACAVLALVGLRASNALRIETALILCLVYAGAVLVGETLALRTPWSASANLDFSRRGFAWRRIATKYLGLCALVGALAFAYWLFPEYRGASFQPVWVALAQLWAPFLALAAVYIAFVDRAMRAPDDALHALGQTLLLRHDPARRGEIGQFLLGWVVKGFFAPIMFHVLVTNCDTLLRAVLDPAQLTFSQFYGLAIVALFGADVLVACCGYVFSLRLFDTHIRSSEPTALGWAACLSCYPPFQNAILVQYFAMNANSAIVALADTPLLQQAFGVVGLTLLAIYALATLAFGCRFSNMTHRGIITNGPYRYTKHPAYVCKNLFWWLAHSPLLALANPAEALRYAVMLAGVTAIYVLRARTEERHLSHDPEYVAYALYIDRHGLFARLGRVMPILRYRPPENWLAQDTPYRGLGTPA